VTKTKQIRKKTAKNAVQPAKINFNKENLLQANHLWIYLIIFH